jgi:hypothetical protein
MRVWRTRRASLRATVRATRLVWMDVRDAADCPAVDAYRQSLIDGTPIAAPAPLTDCPAQFGNNDIYGGTYLDPTP